MDGGQAGDGRQVRGTLHHLSFPCLASPSFKGRPAVESPCFKGGRSLHAYNRHIYIHVFTIFHITNEVLYLEIFALPGKNKSVIWECWDLWPLKDI